MEILRLLIPIVLVYVVYQHFAAPFKNIKRAKQQKLLVKALSDRVKNVMCDEVFLDRIKGFKKALDQKTITQEEYDKIVADIYKEREKEMFPNE